MGKIYITNTALPILTGNVLSIFHFSATKTSSYAARLFCSLIVLTAVIGTIASHGIVEASGPVVIGALHWGKFPFSHMMKNSYDMALESINSTGGINGRPVKLIYADDQGMRKEGETAVRDLAKNQKAVMLVGGYASTNTVYTAGMADDLDIPFLISTAADDRITQRNWKNIYRMNPPAQEYAKGLEKLLLKKVKPASLSIVYENSPYGTGGALQMLWFCREHDIEVRKVIPYHKERTTRGYYRKLLRTLKENPPDVIYMVSYLDDAVSIVKNIRELNINSLLVGGAGGFTSPRFIEMAGPASDNLLTATLWTPHLPYEGIGEYYKRYITRYGTPPDYHGAEAYSVLLVAADALKRASSFSPEAIRAALDTTDMNTVFGPVNFKSYGNFRRQNSLPTMVLQIINNTYECVWPGSIASAKFIPPSNWREPEHK
jgi:branched-chain amino acid transport system substrate-binding protein